MTADPNRIYRQLNRAQKGQWTRLARTFSMAHANEVMAKRARLDQEPLNGIICGGTADDRRKMAAWVKEELRNGG